MKAEAGEQRERVRRNWKSFVRELGELDEAEQVATLFRTRRSIDSLIDELCGFAAQPSSFHPWPASFVVPWRGQETEVRPQ